MFAPKLVTNTQLSMKAPFHNHRSQMNNMYEDLSENTKESSKQHKIYSGSAIWPTSTLKFMTLLIHLMISINYSGLQLIIALKFDYNSDSEA